MLLEFVLQLGYRSSYAFLFFLLVRQLYLPRKFELSEDLPLFLYLGNITLFRYVNVVESQSPKCSNSFWAATPLDMRRRWRSSIYLMCFILVAGNTPPTASIRLRGVQSTSEGWRQRSNISVGSHDDDKRGNGRKTRMVLKWERKEEKLRYEGKRRTKRRGTMGRMAVNAVSGSRWY